MKTSLVALLAITPFIVQAEQIRFTPPAPAPQPPPTVVDAPPREGSTQVYVYDQKPLGAQPELTSQQQAEGIIEQFKTNYAKANGTHFLICVNGTLAEQQAAIKLVTQSTEATTNALAQSAAGTMQFSSGATPEPALADRQTVRDVERLVGRPLRAAGLTLLENPLSGSLAPQPAADSTANSQNVTREALRRTADVVVEVLVTSRNITVTEISGDQIYTVPDIQMTAIRLKDGKIIGQSSATDVLSRAGNPGYAARNFGVEAVTEATTLALMDDMLMEAK